MEPSAAATLGSYATVEEGGREEGREGEREGGEAEKKRERERLIKYVLNITVGKDPLILKLQSAS